MKQIVKSILKKFGYQLVPIPVILKGEVVKNKRYKLLKYDQTKDAEVYRKSQEDGNIQKIKNVWAKPDNIEQVADYLLSVNPKPDFILCHGTRNGFEQNIFSRKLGCKVLGTEISSTATQFPMTIQWDFHNVKDEWLNNVDLIYSNSLDHSHSPIECLQAWISCLKPGGLLVIDKASDSDPHRVTDMDPFGITFDNLVMLLLESFTEQIMIRSILSPREKKENTNFHGLLVVQKIG